MQLKKALPTKQRREKNAQSLTDATVRHSACCGEEGNAVWSVRCYDPTDAPNRSPRPTEDVERIYMNIFGDVS